MAHYFFDIDDGGDFSTDGVGVTCASDTAASRMAYRTICELATERTDGTLTRQVRMSVRDGSGQPLFHLALNVDFQRLLGDLPE